jgi:hypothetical protein
MVPYASMRSCDFSTLVPPINDVVPLSPVFVYTLAAMITFAFKHNVIWGYLFG